MTRGDVVRLPAGRQVDSRVQQGERYGVVVQTDELAALSTVIVAPTSTVVRSASFRPEVEVLGRATHVLVEQLRAVDVEKVEFVGHLTAEELWGVDAALILVLDLARPES